jgi:hypothetical protein
MSGSAHRRKPSLKALLRAFGSRPRVGRSDKAIRLPKIRRAPVLHGYLSAVVIAKDEASYLVEWLEFHRLVGFEHVYLYDNGSTDGTPQVLRPYLQSGYVTFIPWASYDLDGRIQYQAYAHALCNFGPSWRWMAFIDVDEFLFPLESRSLRTVLSAYEDLPAIGVQWHMFGPSGHKRRPAGLVIENYTKRAPVPSLAKDAKRLSKWKSIVDPTKVKAVSSPHAFTLEDWREGAYDEDRRWIVKSQKGKSVSKILRLNHYFTKSEEELAIKMAKGSVGAKLKKNARPKTWAASRAEPLETQTVTDKAILRFAAQLRKRLGGTAVGQEFDNNVEVAK